jgi:hypothetical protein
MKKHSCGAILYTVCDNNIYIILGKEGDGWFPFKGTHEKNETYEQTAIREVEEETCKAVILSNITLDCNYSTKRKYYHLGIARVDPKILQTFNDNKYFLFDKKYLEKTELKFFSLKDIKKEKFHMVTDIPISHYWDFLYKKQISLNKVVHVQ